MISIEKPNPFKVLKLPTDATSKSINEKHKELVVLAESEELKIQYDNARSELTKRLETRLQFELFEIPSTKYENVEWERFVRSFKRNPVNFKPLAKNALPPHINDLNLEAIIALLFDSMLAIDRVDTQVALERLSSKSGSSKPPIEVQDAIFR